MKVALMAGANIVILFRDVFVTLPCLSGPSYGSQDASADAPSMLAAVPPSDVAPPSSEASKSSEDDGSGSR